MSFSIVDIPNGPTSDELTQETLELLSLKDDLSIAHLKKLGVQLEMNEERIKELRKQNEILDKGIEINGLLSKLIMNKLEMQDLTDEEILNEIKKLAASDEEILKELEKLGNTDEEVIKGIKELAEKGDEMIEKTKQINANIEEIKDCLKKVEENQKEIVAGLDDLGERVASQYTELTEDNREIIQNLVKLGGVQQIMLKKTDKMVEQLQDNHVNLLADIKEGHYLAEYADSFRKLRNLRKDYERMSNHKNEANTSFNNDATINVFIKSTDPIPLANAINSGFEMLTGKQDAINPTSIFSSLPNLSCNLDVYGYYTGVLQQSIDFYKLGHTLRNNVKAQNIYDPEWFECFAKSEEQYLSHCGCPLGLTFQHRGQISNLITELNLDEADPENDEGVITSSKITSVLRIYFYVP